MAVITRTAGSPASWGARLVPDGRYQMRPERVLDEMWEVGLIATELGPLDYFPSEDERRSRLLDDFCLKAVGGIVYSELYDSLRDPVAELARTLDSFAAVGASMAVLCVSDAPSTARKRFDLGAEEWARVYSNLERVAVAAADRNICLTVLPRLGTALHSEEDVWRLLDRTTLPLCLDTAQLLFMGVDPAEFTASVASRVAHVHLKDVSEMICAQVSDLELSHHDGVRLGLYRPLGTGIVDVAAVIGALERAGYAGWYVVEQDTFLEDEPPPAAGPVADASVSVSYLRALNL